MKPHLPAFKAYPYHYIGSGLLAFAMAYLLFHFADSKGLDLKYAVTQVKQRHHRELSHTRVISTSGGTVRTRKRAIQPAWTVAVEIGGTTGWAQVPPGDYDDMIEGAEVEVVYARKRITRGLAIKTIRIMKPVD